jgi:predicted Fe-S protein YdhL (DUF1289 family)
MSTPAQAAAAGAAGVPSPCTNVCRMDARSGWCLGCLRSIDEIIAWPRLDDAGKRAVLTLLPTRRAGADRPA